MEHRLPARRVRTIAWPTPLERLLAVGGSDAANRVAALDLPPARRHDRGGSGDPFGAAHLGGLVSSVALFDCRLRAPGPLTPLVGRKLEAEAAARLLGRSDVRLLTLTGLGGVGKTRFALAIAADMSGAFADGVTFVGLGSVRDPGLVIPTLAAALGVRQEGPRPLDGRLRDALGGRRMLVVLDNLEQVAAAAPAVVDLLADCPGLTVLATSRAPLRVRGEHLLEILPLPTPDPASAPRAADLAQNEAVTLFLQRATAANPAFALDDDNARTVAEICARLEGLPLALELAAARLRVLSPAALLARLTHRLALLTHGARDSPARHRTLRATIAWSDDLLSSAAGDLLRRLAVFDDGCGLEAVEAAFGIAAGRSEVALEALAELVDHHLLRRDAGDAEPRFRMLETVREYATERLEASGDAEATRHRHAAYHLAVAERANAGLDGPDQGPWLERLDVEYANLRGALSWAMASDAETALRLGTALRPYWEVRGLLHEGRAWLERALRQGEDATPAVRARALAAAAPLAAAQGDHAHAADLLRQALPIWRTVGDSRGIAVALTQLGALLDEQGKPERAVPLLEEALGLWREHGQREGIAAALNDLGAAVDGLGDGARATALYEEALALWRDAGNLRHTAVALTNLGAAVLVLGNAERASNLYGEALLLFRDLGDRYGTAVALTNLGEVAVGRGDHDRASGLLLEALAIFVRLGTAPATAQCLEMLAASAQGQGARRAAARLLGAAEGVRHDAGVPLLPLDIVAHGATVAAVRAALGEAEFGAAWSEGRAAPLDRVGDLVRGVGVADPAGVDPSRVEPASPPGISDFTPRELDFLRLVAEGRSNREIAHLLGISRHTVRTKVSRLLVKLAAPSRSAAAAHAVHSGLA